MGTLTAGIKEIFSTAKTSGTNVMLCANDGTPDGHITMPNLASVLGGITLQVTVKNYDLNNAPYGRVGSSNGDISSTLVNAPEQGKRANFVCTTYKCDGADQYKVQEFVYTSSLSSNPTKYIRKSRLNGAVVAWDEWYQMYDTSLLTNSTLLTSLASALGAANVKSSTLGDCDTPTSFIHYVGPSTSNNPTGTGSNYLLTFFIYSSNVSPYTYSMQLLYSYYSNQLYFRSHNGTAWNSWKQVNLT